MKIAGLFLVLFLLSACSHKDSIPTGILNQDSMRNILWDIMQVDQYSVQYLSKDSAKINLKAQTIALYQRIFQNHHVSREDFNKSYQFYIAHPDLTKTMLDSLTARANRERAEVYKNPVQIKAK